MFRKFVCVFTAIALVAGLCPGLAFASDYSKSGVLSTLKAYDSNGYYIVKNRAGKGDNILEWWDDANDIRNFGTTVHEECHAWSFAVKGNAQRIYVGSKKSVKVKYTKTFKTVKAAASVPESLRTNRFYTYLGYDNPNLDSNRYGAYGLLNEFMAYCWGFNTLVRLYDKVQAQPCTDTLWLEYYAGTANTALSYAEFRYFIEHYLYYAKKHKPSVYKKIMKNKAFKKAVKKIDRKFSSLIKAYDKRIASSATLLGNAGYLVYSNGDYLMAGTYSGTYGYNMYIEQYNAFAQELGKSKYRTIQKKLELTTVKKRSLPV